MKWPRLVPPAVCCTPCTVVLTGAEGEDGAPQVLAELSLACNWQDKPRQELDAERQKQLKLVADLTANSVSSSQVDSITGYLSHWEDVSFDDRRRVLDTLVSKVEATRTELAIEWKI